MTMIKRKVCLLGDPAVGKTSLIRRFVVEKYDDKYISTLGTKVSKKTLKYERSQQMELTMMIWDLAGQKEFHQVHSAAFKNATGALIVGDVTRKKTLDNIENWILELFRARGQIPIVLLANKSDLMNQAEVTKEYVESIASKINIAYFLTSAKTGDNVEEAFNRLGEMILGTAKPSQVNVDYAITPEKAEFFKGKTVLEIEDNLIMRFCDIIGDTELGMSIVRGQFGDTDIDFNNPSFEELKIIVDRLVESIRKIKGEKQADEAMAMFKTYLELAKGQE
jgi:small GTP-binding protein